MIFIPFSWVQLISVEMKFHVLRANNLFFQKMFLALDLVFSLVLTFLLLWFHLLVLSLLFIFSRYKNIPFSYFKIKILCLIKNLFKFLWLKSCFCIKQNEKSIRTNIKNFEEKVSLIIMLSFCLFNKIFVFSIFNFETFDFVTFKGQNWMSTSYCPLNWLWNMLLSF